MESRVGATDLFNILDYSFIRDRAEKNREKNDAAPFLVSPRCQVFAKGMKYHEGTRLGIDSYSPRSINCSLRIAASITICSFDWVSYFFHLVPDPSQN